MTGPLITIQLVCILEILGRKDMQFVYTVARNH